jgi:hypothetical protein
MTAMSRCWGVLAIVLAVAVVAAPGSMAVAQQRVGVNSAVNPEASGTPPGAATRKLVVGQEVVHNEHIATGPAGQSQILFIDESALTVAPNSDMTIDDFVYDPNTGKGKLAMSVTEGVLRFVGGKLSKNENAVTLQTPTATLAIRGGIFVMNQSKNGSLQVVLLYGKELTVTGNCGLGTQCPSQKIIAPGFSVSVSAAGAAPTPPAPAPAGTVATMFSQLTSPNGATGGSTTQPTDSIVASSGIANTVSANVTTSVQQAVQNTPPSSQPTLPNISSFQNGTNLSSISAQADPAIVALQQNPTPPGTPISPSTTQPVVIQVSGLAKSTNGPATLAGFIDQTLGGGRYPFSGTITYPSGTLQNGVFFGTATTGQTGMLSPLTPGSTNTVNFQTSSGDTEVGTATMTADGNFFYANLLSTSPNFPGNRDFIFGGVPVGQNFYAGNLPAQILAFNVNPDGALGTSTSGQTIPFLPSNYGGTMPNAIVSPLYLATGANSPFGQANSAINNFVAPKFLQASLAINGQGINQASALAVATGNFFTYSGTGTVVAAGPIRGTVMLNATSPSVHISSGLATVGDPNGNTLFGGNTLSGFVLDQNQYSFSGAYVPALASAAQFGATTASYAFNQPVTTTPLPANAAGTQQNLNETGYFGGIMTHTTNPTAGSPYVLTGTTAVQSTVSNNRIAATFAGSDPFTSAQSGITSMVLIFGDNTSGTNASRGTYIDNNIYAATDSPVTASTINGNPLPLPPNNTTTAPSPSIAMVTSGTLGSNANSWMPAGVTPCACQYLQWGYWTGQVTSTASQGLGVARTDRAYINTWVAGQPTVNMPTMGMGTFNGAAVGTVFNNGATYLAAGNFNQTYNFGSLTGTVNINNFDGASYMFGVTGSGRTFTSGVTPFPANRQGFVSGGFFGPGAIETGGSFNIQSTAGSRYIASGIFAGH